MSPATRRTAATVGLLAALALAAAPGCSPAPVVVAAPAAAAGVRYRCPMHHQYTTTDPRARCPECQMFMNERVPTVADGARQQVGGVRRARVERRTVAAEVRAAAVIAPDETRVAHVHTKLSGWISRLYVTETGAAVRRGAPLLAIYSEELYRAQQEYLALRRSAGAADPALVAAARQRLALLDMPAGEIDAIERSGAPRRDVVLRSPLAGFVLARNVAEGSYVRPGTDLFVVADLGRVWAMCDVAEEEAHGVVAGLPAELRLAAYPEAPRRARVARVYPDAAGATRTVRLRLELDNRDGALKPGMYGEARLEVTVRDALWVPAEAVLSTGAGRVVFVPGPGGTFAPRAVSVGRRAGGQLQIRDGLAAGDQVVASAGFLFDSESDLRAAVAGMRRERAP